MKKKKLKKKIKKLGLEVDVAWLVAEHAQQTSVTLYKSIKAAMGIKDWPHIEGDFAEGLAAMFVIWNDGRNNLIKELVALAAKEPSNQAGKDSGEQVALD